MRVLSIGNFSNPSWDGSLPDEEHIAKALENLGIEVIRQQRETGWDEALPKVDFILIAQWDGYPLDALQNIPIPLVYWAFDYQADGQEWHERLVAKADLYLSKRIADSKYPNWQWFSQDFAPDFLHPFDKVEKDIDVLFTGSYLPWAEERNSLLKTVDSIYNLAIHSVTPNEWKAQGFKDVRGPVMDHGLPELYARAKINLSIDHVNEAGYWSDRNAQIMACGGFVLFRYVPLSEAVFKEGIMYFYNEADLVSKIALFLEREDERNAIADRGAELAQTASDRVHELLIILGQKLI